MTTNYHTPIPSGAAADDTTFNGPLAELDAEITSQLSRIVTLEAEMPEPSGNATEYYDGDGNWTVPAGTGASVDGHLIKDEGVSLPQRAVIDFVGAGVTVTNEAGGTQVSIPGGAGIETVVAGTGISVDNTDPVNPVISANGLIASVIAGTGISVDNTDPVNPVISATVVGGGSVLEVQVFS